MSGIPDKPRGKPKRVVVTIEYEDSTPDTIELSGNLNIEVASSDLIEWVDVSIFQRVALPSRFVTYTFKVTKDRGPDYNRAGAYV